MIKLKKILTETPDRIKDGIYASSTDARTFIYFDKFDKFFIDRKNNYHDPYTMFDENKMRAETFIYTNNIDDDTVFQTYINGRLWLKLKYMSLWIYPPIIIYKKMLKNLNKNFNIKIDNSWKLEIYHYVGSDTMEFGSLVTDLKRDDIEDNMLKSKIISALDYGKKLKDD